MSPDQGQMNLNQAQVCAKAMLELEDTITIDSGHDIKRKASTQGNSTPTQGMTHQKNAEWWQ